MLCFIFRVHKYKYNFQINLTERVRSIKKKTQFESGKSNITNKSDEKKRKTTRLLLTHNFFHAESKVVVEMVGRFVDEARYNIS